VPGVLRMYDTRCLKYAGAKPKVLSVEKYEGGATVTLTADAYVHGVHLKGNCPMSDNYFDLIPGQVKKVDVKCECADYTEWYTVC